MEFNREEGDLEPAQPVSPTGQYFTSSAISSLSVIGVLESEIPIDDSHTMTLLTDVFLPVNPRFSSIMVEDRKGKKHWKKVEVNFQDHIHVPTFPQGESPDFYEDCLTQYLSNLARDQFPLARPLWEIHIIKYRTKNAAGNLIFKLHHALGDGYSLMGALLSCFQRADNPTIPLTFPSLNPKSETGGRKGICGNLTRVSGGIFNTLRDFGWSLLKSTVIEDDKSAIRSGEEGVEFRPITITTLTFSLDQIKQIKANLHVTINDVICGVLFLGIRLYMQAMNHELRNAKSTALVLLNTRNIGGYKSVSEMVEPDAQAPWGNRFAFLHVSVPKLSTDLRDSTNPLKFVLKAKKIVKRKKNSGAVILTGKFLETLRKFRGPEVTAKYIHSTLKNTSMTISNIIGPRERMALDDHPVKGLYFMVVGIPQNLAISVLSYMGKLRVAFGTENGLIDAHKFNSCVQNAYDIILKAAVTSPADSVKNI